MKSVDQREGHWSLLRLPSGDRILAFLDHVVENHDLDTQQNLDSIDLGSKLDRRQIHEVRCLASRPGNRGGWQGFA